MLCAWTHPESPKHSIHHQPECAAAMPSFIQFTRPATGNLGSHMEQTRSLLYCRICTRNQHDFIHRWMQICRPRLLSACAHKQRIATFFSSRIHTGRHTIFMFNHFECRANGPQTHILHKTVDTNSPINIIYPCPIVVCILISNTEKSITIRSNVTHKTNRYAHAILLQQCCNGIYSKFSEMSLRLFAIAIGQYYAYGIPLRQCAHSPITLHSRAKIDGNQQKKTCNKSAVQPFCHMSRSKRSHRGGRTQKFIIIMFTATRLYEVR